MIPWPARAEPESPPKAVIDEPGPSQGSNAESEVSLLTYSEDEETKGDDGSVALRLGLRGHDDPDTKSDKSVLEQVEEMLIKPVVAVEEAAEAVFGKGLPETPALVAELEEFCGMKLGKESEAVVDCGCCADHLAGDAAAQATLLFGSSQVSASAFVVAAEDDTLENFEKQGQVPLWSIGDRTPQVICDRKRPLCQCEDPPWRVEDVTCRPGSQCRRGRVEPFEGPSQDDGEVENEPADDDTDGLPSCTVAGEAKPRISLGSARCEDAAVSQCAQLFARESPQISEDSAASGGSGDTEDDRWHHCEVRPKVRRCGARTIRLADAMQAEEERKVWLIERAYTPETNWAVTIGPSGTYTVTERPERAAAIEQLRKRLADETFGGPL